MAQGWDKKYSKGDVNARLMTCLEKLPLLLLLQLLYTKNHLIYALLAVAYWGYLFV